MDMKAAPSVEAAARPRDARGRVTSDALMRAEPRLERVVDLARQRLGAREVWLFGSRARGDNRQDSDWDILLVLDDAAPEEAMDPVALWRVGRDAGLTADVVADRASDFRAWADVVTTLPYEVKREGIRLG